MKKSPKNLKAKTAENFLIIIPFLLVLIIISRTIPDGTIRLNIGESGIGEKAIALTFDDGPSGYTEELLDGLELYDAKASFFVIGSQAEKNPGIVDRAYEDGHLVGNHTYSHIDFYKTSLSEIEKDIRKGANVINSITGEEPIFLRAPYGNVNFIQLKQLDCFFIHWSSSTLDWFREDEEYIYNRIMKEAKDGAIILMHDTREVTVKAVLRAIPELQEQGFEFVRVDELLSRNGEKLKMGVPYRSCKYDRGAVAF
ncbi:MAG: peptidoglycan N-acetylglucosamine deacetylase [Ruminococcaceae bacterium]|nr:peptidoglycan N-acetylglucosamine deacetylase [Oscillospiraceae bacterium]